MENNMQYFSRDLADEDDVRELEDKITAVLDILHIKSIIDREVDHYDVEEYRDELREDFNFQLSKTLQEYPE